MITVEGILMNHPKYWFLVLFLLLIGCSRKQPPPPTAATNSPIYDEKADAHRDVAVAIANAEGSQRNIVLIFGANW